MAGGGGGEGGAQKVREVDGIPAPADAVTEGGIEVRVGGEDAGTDRLENEFRGGLGGGEFGLDECYAALQGRPGELSARA